MTRASDGAAWPVLIENRSMGPEIERLRGKKSGWTTQDVWDLIRWSTAKSARIGPAGISRSTNFATDLL